MTRLSVRLCFCLLALALAVPPVAAEVYHVKLHNGSVVDTAYQPVQCAWDAGMVLVMTEVGNWIGLKQNDIESVESETGVRGFGVPISTNTIAIGWAPNDAAEPGTQQPPNPAELAMQQLLAEQRQRANYTVQQGVSSEHTQGIPSGLTGYGGSGGGYGALPLPGYRPPTPPPAAAPAPTMAPAAPAAPPGPG